MPIVLEMEMLWSSARARGVARGHQSNSQDGFVKSSLGRSEDSRWTS